MTVCKLINKTTISRVNNEIAGTDFIIGSLILKCIMIAPIINKLSIIYAYILIWLAHIPMICEEKDIPFGYVRHQEYLGKESGLPDGVKTASIALLEIPKSFQDKFENVTNKIKDAKNWGVRKWVKNSVGLQK